LIAAAIALGVTAWVAAQDPFNRSADSDPAESVFSPAHSSIPQAMSHFFGLRREPRQPIAFVHQVHVEEVQLTCSDCHITAERGPQASIPDIRTCWGCHVNTLTDHPEIKKLKDYYDKGQDIPWQRVWGWVEEAHVRFNHAPHIRKEIDCATCHGDVSKMTVATRAFGHTMGFCVSCHQQNNAPDDCLTCHF
jgi:hypothetical protein